MREVYPDTDLRANSHIKSKIRKMKGDHGILTIMMSTSGFGFSERGKKTEVANEDIWNEFLKTDKKAKGIREKEWPFYNDWDMVEYLGRIWPPENLILIGSWGKRQMKLLMHIHKLMQVTWMKMGHHKVQRAGLGKHDTSALGSPMHQRQEAKAEEDMHN